MRLLIASFILMCVMLSMTQGASVAHAAATCPLIPGKVYRSPLVTTVFYITAECQKRPIFNPLVYFSYYEDWSPVIFVEQSVIDKVGDHPLRFMPWGPRRTFQNGSLIKTTDDPHVYLIEDQKAYPFGTEEAFKAFGYAFSQVEDVSKDSMDKFQKQTEEILNLDMIPQSVVFKYLDSPSVYVLVKDSNGALKKRHIGSMDELLAMARPDRIAFFPDTKTFETISADSGSSDTTDSNSQTTYAPLRFLFNLSEATTTISGSFDLRIVPVNNSEIASVKYAFGSTVLGTVTSTPFSYRLNSTSYPNAANTITAIVTGKNGVSVTIIRPVIVNNVSSTGGGSGGGASGGSGGSSGGGSTVVTSNDTTAPVVTAFSIPSSSNSLAVSVSTFTATDAVGVTGYLITESASTPSASASWSSSPSAIYTVSSTGMYTLYAWARDAAGNISVSRNATTTVVDTTSPLISTVASTTAASSAVITWVTDELATSTVEYGTTVGYGSASSSSVNTQTHSIVINGLSANTLYHFRVSSRDASGNRSVSDDYTFRTLDGSVPTVTSFTIPATSNSRTVSVSTFTATDDVGVTGYLITESSAAPSSAAAGWTASSPGSHVVSSDGTYTLYAWVKDAAGNVSPGVNDSVTVDTVSPVISSISSSTIATSATISWTTDESSTSFVQYGTTSGYGSTTSSSALVLSHSMVITGLTSNAVYHFRVISQDAFGNQAISGDGTFRTAVVADVTAPSVSVTSPSDGATISGSSVSFQASASDNASISSVVFKVDGTVIASDVSSPYGTTFDSTAYVNGTHTLSAVAIDSSSNRATSTISVTVNNVALDTTAPIVTAFTLPATSNSRTVSVSSFTATDAVGVTGYLLTTSSSAPASDDSGWSSTPQASYGFISDGLKTLYAWAKDARGNVSLSVSASVMVDSVAPSVAYTSPSNGSTISGTTALSATASDGYSVASVSFRIDGSVISADTSSPYTASLNTALYADGQHTLTAIATDGAGNASVSTITVTIDNVGDVTAPTIGSVTSSTDRTTAVITWTTNEASTSTVEYGVTSGYGSASSSASFVTSHLIVLTGLDASTTYHFRVKSGDASGNATTSRDYQFTTASTTVRTDLGINIGWPEDWVQDRLFADLVKTSRTWMYPPEESDWAWVDLPQANLDAQGWPTRDARLMVANNYGLQGTYGLYFTGRASEIYVEGADASITNISYNTSTNQTSASVTIHDSGTLVLSIGFRGTSGGVKNVKLMRPTAVGAATSLPQTALVSNEFAAAVEPFSAIRYMNYLATNGNYQHDWTDRVPGDYFTANVKRGVYPEYAEGVGGPWEYIIMISNELHKDAWICLPANVTDDYILQLANLFRDGNAVTGNRGLDSNLHLYIEYSNEVWNGGLPFAIQQGQNHDAAIAEVNAGDAMNLRFDGSTNDWDWASRRVGQRIAQTSNIFRSVFGDSAMHTRIRPVLAWQSRFSGGQGLQALAYLDANKTLFPQPVSYYIYGGGGSAYYDPATESNPGITINTVWNSGTMNPSEFLKESDNSLLTSMFGLHRVAYEGGPSMDQTGDSAIDAVLQAAWKDSRMTNEIVEHHNAWSQMGGELLMYFTLTHDYQWGMLENVWDLTHPKYLGIKALQQSEPVAVAMGHAVGETIPANLHDYQYNARDTSWYDDDRLYFRKWTDEEWYGYAYNVTSTRSYEASVVYTGNGTGTLMLLVDGEVVGGRAMNGPSGTLTGVAVSLTPGLHSVRVKSLSPSGFPLDADLFEIRTVTLAPAQ